MHFYFKSTYSQLTVMFGFLLVVNFIVIILALRQITFAPAAAQMALQLNNQMTSLKPMLQDKSIQNVKDTLLEIFPDREIIVDESPILKKTPALKFYRELHKKLLSENIIRVSINESEHTSKIWLKPAWNNSYWLGFTFQPFISKVSKMFLVLFMALMLMSLLAAYFFSRYMLKPFKQLAHMAADLVQDQPLDDSHQIKGTTEVIEMTRLVKKSALKIQQLHKEKELLLAGVSHDLRTPLARMRLQAEFLSDNEARDSFVHNIEEMDQIIGDFVTYVRLGTLEEFENTEVIELIKTTLEPYIHQGSEILFAPNQTTINLQLKPISVKRMLVNIVDNAIKYGKTPIEIQASLIDNKFLICIRDHGKGLSQQELKSVFEPFVMAQTTNNQYGSGLGLSIVKKLASQNKAKVWAENHTDGGLLVCLEFS